MLWIRTSEIGGTFIFNFLTRFTCQGWSHFGGRFAATSCEETSNECS
jgi:hypothetical protein